MIYTDIAGKKVSAMSLGTVQLGLFYGIANTEGKPDREKCFSILDAALEKGITAIDTARNYGDAEDVLGAYFLARPEAAEKAFITTKLASFLPPGAPAAEVEKSLYHSVETSLSKLGLKKADCLLLHNAMDMTQHGSVVAGTIRNILKKGYARIAGVSVYYPNEAEAMLDNDLWQVVQLPMNIFDERFVLSGAVEKLRKKNISVFVRSVFFQGLFFLDPDTVTDPNLVQYAVPHIRALRDLADRAGISVAQFTLAYIRDLPGVTSLVLGAENRDQVYENAALFETSALEDALRQEAEKQFSGINYEGIMATLSKPRK
jgi:aryl-alcohol dehydrogenase-like predicted oxidoreductase